MEGDSHKKHSLQDPQPSSSLPKKPRKSNERKLKSSKEINNIKLQSVFQKSIKVCDEFFATKLQPEFDSLIQSRKSLETQYQNLKKLLSNEQTLKFIDKKYETNIKKSEKFQNDLLDIRNKVRKLQETKKVTTNGKFKKLLSLNKKSKELLVKITKEKQQIDKTKIDIVKKIDFQEKANQTKIKRQTVKGDEFQRTLQVLLRQRALSWPGAEVGVEVSGVGQLDDAVYAKKSENKYRFFQIKHKTNKLPLVTASELFKYSAEDSEEHNDANDDDKDEASKLPNTVLKGEVKKKGKEQSGLHLLMYFKSFCKIKENTKFEECEIEEITIITNRDIDLSTRKKGQEWLSLLKKCETKEDECLDFENRKAQKYGLNVKEAKENFFHILSKESHTYLIKKKDNAEQIIDEFLEKIHIVVNYPDEADLRKRTFNEVFREVMFHSLPREIPESFMIYTEIKLLQLKKEFTTNLQWESEMNEMKKFINGIKSVTLTDLKKQSVKSDMCFSIEFNNLDDLTEDLKHLVNENHHYVLDCTGNNMKMNAIKIINILQGRLIKKEFLFCEYENLLTADFLLEDFMSSHYFFLVVMCKNVTSDGEKLSTKLGNALSSSKKMIIVSEGKNSFTSSMKNLLNDKYVCKMYQHGYKYLSPTCRENIQRKQINFQMKDIALGELIRDDLANEVFDDNCLYAILDKDNTEINVSDGSSFCSSEYSEEYYIPREFYQKTISFDTLDKYSDTNIFFVTGTNKMTENKIKTVFSRKKVNEKLIQKWEDRTEAKCGIFLMESYDRINKIMSSSSKNAYWISMNDCSNLFLIDSTEDQFSDHKLTLNEPLKAEKDLDTTYSLGCIVILVGDSGIGKSTTLTSMANKIRQSCSSTWVARVILRKAFLIKILENVKNFVSPDDAIECVCKMIGTDESHNILDDNLIKKGLKYSYRDKFRFILLLDGFNEINETLQEKLIILIKALRNHCNVDQIWITTQNHCRVKLETDLEVSSYFLKPLNDKEQIKLMASYWKTEYNKINAKVKYNNDDLYVKAEFAIKQFKLSVNDEEKKQFTQNSLNLRMLADVLLYENIKINEGINLFDLYEIFVQQKFSVFRRETAFYLAPEEQNQNKSMCSNDRIEDRVNRKLFERCVRDILQQFSVNTFLKNNKSYKGLEKKLPQMDAYEKFKNCVGILDSELTLSKLGLLILKNNEFDFIHPSFAQFFFCEYLIKIMFQLDCTQLNKFWVQLILTTDSFKSCRKFLDHALKRLEESKRMERVRKTLASSLTTILIQKTRKSSAAIKENLYYLSLFLFRWLNENDTKKYVRKILKQDFESKDFTSQHIDEFIEFITTISKEQSVRLLISFYQNKNKVREMQSSYSGNLKSQTNSSYHQEVENNSKRVTETKPFSDQDSDVNFDSSTETDSSYYDEDSDDNSDSSTAMDSSFEENHKTTTIAQNKK